MPRLASLEAYLWASPDPFPAMDGLLLIVVLVVRDCGWSVLVPGDGEVVDLADGDAGGDVRRGECGQARPAGEQGGQRDFAMEPGQGRAQAEVGSGGEAEVRVWVAADVELIGIREGGGVAVGGGQEQQAWLPGWARDAVDAGIRAGGCGGERRRGDQPQHFLDRGGPASWVLLQRGQRLGVSAEQVGAESEEDGGGLVPGIDEEDAVRDQVLALLAF